MGSLLWTWLRAAPLIPTSLFQPGHRTSSVMPLDTTHIYLRKASDRLVSHCKCSSGLITFPPQMACPWCGCGWLFTCIECRRAYTFAKGVVLNESWEETAKRDLRSGWGKEPTVQDVQSWVGVKRGLLGEVVEGEEYVCLDGLIIQTSVSAVRFNGLHSRHDLPYVPQVAAVSDPSVLQLVLGDPKYWKSTAHPDGA